MSRTFQQRFLRKQKKKRDAEKPPVKQQTPPAKPDGGSRKPASSGAQLSPPPPLESTPVVNRVPPETMEPSDALFPRAYGGEETMGDYKKSTAPKRGEAPDTEVKPPSSLVTSTPMQSATEEPSSPTYFPPLPEGPSLPVEAPKKLAKVPKSKRGVTQLSSVTADDYQTLTGAYRYDPKIKKDGTPEDMPEDLEKVMEKVLKFPSGKPKPSESFLIRGGPAQVEVVGGTGKGYDKKATPQERQERADQFLRDYPVVDVAGKSPDQVRSEMASVREKYLKAVEGKKAPKRESKIKRPLSERAPEYRDTKQGREYFRPVSVDDGGEYSPDTGSYGVWERDPVKDRNYPDERFRREKGPLKGDERTEMQKELQRNLAAKLRSKLAIDPNYWRDPANAEELAKLKGRALRQGKKEVNLTSEQFESFITKETKGAVIARDRANMLERQRAIVENPANWAMKGLQDPSDIAKTRKRMYPDQTAEQQEIIAEERRKAAEEAIEEYKKQKKDKDKD